MTSAEELVTLVKDANDLSFVLLYDHNGKLVMEKGKGRPPKNDASTSKLSLYDVLCDETEDFQITEAEEEELNTLRQEESKKVASTRKSIVDNLQVKEDGDVKILLGCAWCTDDELQLWNAFPEALSMDTTMQTNNEKRSLFSIAYPLKTMQVNHIM